MWESSLFRWILFFCVWEASSFYVFELDAVICRVLACFHGFGQGSRCLELLDFYGRVGAFNLIFGPWLCC